MARSPRICNAAVPVLAAISLAGCGDDAVQQSPEAESKWAPAPWEQVGEGLEVVPLAQGGAGAGKFTRLDGVGIGIDFRNLLRRENIKNYLLTGAGLAVGDLDGNGLPDVFLVSQDGANRLFFQDSPWQFRDGTGAAGIVDTKSSGAGAAIADIDNDGDLDLYVCNKGGHDELYLNRGDGTFAGGSVGAGDPGTRAPTMVAFSDYDRDGDLDFYRSETRLLSIKEIFDHRVLTVKDAQGRWQAHPSQEHEFEMVDGVPRELGTQDRLFRNEGVNERGMPRLVEVTRPAGIAIAREHGLAAAWWDYDDDGWPDLYVSNDFHTPDRLYHNKRDGTFREVTAEALPYTSWFSMGNDVADINNDGRLDLLTSDMSATTHFKQKTMMGAMTDTAWFLDNLEPRQYMRNTLQVNTGTGQFLDVAFYAGLDSTDWTWSALFGDLDCDGREDAFFTNGIERNVQDSDINLRMAEAKNAGATREELQEIFLEGPRFAERNLAFRNLGDLRFESLGEGWGLGDATVSHGAVMADLDRDGDLDIVVNNMNDPVGIYRNDLVNGQGILVSLKGVDSNRFGLGTKITVELDGGETLTRVMTSARGYMSGTEPVAHIGLGPDAVIQLLRIRWPSGRIQEYAQIAAGSHYRVTEADADIMAERSPAPEAVQPLLAEVEGALGIEFAHHENYFDDFDAQPLLPNRMSRFGPSVAASGDRIYLGGAAGRKGALFHSDGNGQFSRVSAPGLDADEAYEDVAAAWLDADGDGDLDLYIVSGGASKPAGDAHYQDRLYLEQADGGLVRAEPGVLPDWKVSGSCVAPCDFDGDGDIDLFVGGRFVPGRYPESPESALFRNEGGRFTRADSQVAAAGLVTGAAWGDTDGDGRPDLILSTEWGPVRVYQNLESGFVETTEPSGLAGLTGWWNCVAAGDLDADGDIDLVAGNFGLNTKYGAPGPGHPASLFAADFSGDGTLKIVEGQHKEGKLLPVRGRSCSTTAMPHLIERAPSYAAFALKTLEQLYTPDALGAARRMEASTLATTLFRNDGAGSFAAEPLPLLSQLAPIMGAAIGDLNGDGADDIVLAQNFNAAQRETGRMNAGLGVVLTGAPGGGLDELWPEASGMALRVDARQIAIVGPSEVRGAFVLIGVNGGAARVFQPGSLDVARMIGKNPFQDAHHVKELTKGLPYTLHSKHP